MRGFAGDHQDGNTEFSRWAPINTMFVTVVAGALIKYAGIIESDSRMVTAGEFIGALGLLGIIITVAGIIHEALKTYQKRRKERKEAHDNIKRLLNGGT